METTAAARRPWFLIFLAVVQIVLYSFVAMVLAPPALDPLMSVPPNRYFQPPAPMMAAFMATMRTDYVVAAYLATLVACGLIYRKLGDRAIGPMSSFVILLILATMGLGSYIFSLPSWVEAHYGREIRASIYASP